MDSQNSRFGTRHNLRKKLPRLMKQLYAPNSFATLL